MATELVIVETQRGSLTVAQPGGLGAPGKPGGDGDPGPTAVSADEGNAATLGSDGLLFVPESSGGAVDSVNGQTGTVVLDAEDVSADPVGSAAAAQAAAEGTAAGALTGHAGDTTDVHGIVDTSDLVLDDDPRLTDPRAPLGHAASHATGGTDALSAADVGAAAASHTHSLADVTDAGDAAGLDVGTTAGTVAAGDDSRLADARTPTGHAASHGSAGSDPVTVAQSQVSGLADALAGKAASAHTHTPEQAGADPAGAAAAAQAAAESTAAGALSDHAAATTSVHGIADTAHLLSAGSPLTDLSSGAAPLGQISTADGDGGITWTDPPEGGGGSVDELQVALITQVYGG